MSKLFTLAGSHGKSSFLINLSRQVCGMRTWARVTMPLLMFSFLSLTHAQYSPFEDEPGDDVTYTLTVNNGTGSGSYLAGTVVGIEADPAPVGQEFDQWIGDVAMVADAAAAATTITMPEADALVTATYRDVLYTLTVNGGAGSGSYTAGTVVGIEADPAPVGQEFDQWIGDVAMVADAAAASTTLTMPAADALVTATYRDVFYTLTVNGGTGSGSYTAGTVVGIEADPAPVGQEFDQWIGDVAMVADAAASSTTITMPAADALVAATYRDVFYTLTVNGGTGSGSYVAGTIVAIVAAPAPAGKEFDRWTGDVANVADVASASTTLTMPPADAIVTATYRDVLYTLTVNGGTGSGSYVAGTMVAIVAAPAPAGKEFDQWTGDVATVADAAASSTTITMPAADALVTATYRDVFYTLTVNGGAGSGSYVAGTIVAIVAASAPAGKEFDQWTGDVAMVADVTSSLTTITMPAGDASVTATYRDVQYVLTVNGGTGSGSYVAGTVVGIEADPAPVGQEFDRWTGDVANVVDVTSASTTITMPFGDAVVTATYKDRFFALTVNSGSGSGSYLAGTTVALVADEPPIGQEFDRWTGDVANVADVASASTTLTMPPADAIVTATFKAVLYTLTVNGGTGSGTYVYGTVVSIVAGAAPPDQEFDQWTGDIDGVANVNASSTIIAMPAANAAVTAIYRARQYSLTVDSGIGSGSYVSGTTVNIVADAAPAGQQFERWIGDVANVANVNSASTTLTMPAAHITVTATYKARQFTLTVNSGTGSGSYTAGTTVNIVAATAPVGQQFDRWTGDVDNVANVNAASTFITMPAANATVTATFKARQYTLTVDSGSGSGSYTAGTTVNIVAATPPVGQEFDRWTGDVANVGNVNAASTFITMPAANASVTATYRARQYELTVNGGTGSGRYAAGTTVNMVVDEPPTGQEFDRWIGDVANVANVSEPSTTITMPTGDVTVSATFKARQFTLTVNSGTGSGSYTFGTTVNIVADPAPADEEFDQWTGDVATVANANEASTFITMPAADAVVTATYRFLPRSLTVNGGTGSGDYVPGTSVDIVAAAAPAGKEFDQWTGDVENVADINAASTTIMMPLTDTTLTATYKDRQYTLTVSNGAGSGSYLAGTIVEIVADPAPEGQEFDQWIGDVANVLDVDAASTSITVPMADATVTAVYRLPGGITAISPIDSLTATGDAGMVTAINGISVSELRLGATVFPNPNPTYPAANADDFDLGSIASADNQPYFECSFAYPVTTVFFLESGANDSGFMQAYDAEGNRLGARVGFTISDYFVTEYRSGNNQVVGGLVVHLTGPVTAIRVTPPTSGVLGFDPLSISAVSTEQPPVPPTLVWQRDPVSGSWELVWSGDNWVLQYGTSPDGDWSDVEPPATRPYVVLPEEALMLYRLRQAGPE